MEDLRNFKESRTNNSSIIGKHLDERWAFEYSSQFGSFLPIFAILNLENDFLTFF